jgi:aldehyde dehydrogenase (NAD(P)+)
VHYGVPQIHPEKIRSRPNGQVAVEVFPYDIFDRLLYRGFRAEVWMQPEVYRDQLSETMATFYKQRQPEGKVSLILGAGNVSSIAMLDVIYKLFVEGRVCLLKPSPINDYIGSFIEEAFASFIQEGYLRRWYMALPMWEPIFVSIAGLMRFI